MSISDSAVTGPDLYTVTSGEVHLLAGECTPCGTLVFPAAGVCPECQAEPTRRRELASRGTIYSFTVVRARPPDYAGPVPYGFGLVELPEAIRVATVLLAEDLDTLHIGCDVAACTFDDGGEPPMQSYAFRPVGGSG
jgi:uncharacterized OB-fold protein